MRRLLCTAAAPHHRPPSVHHVLCFPGDGIGPEIVGAACRVLTASAPSVPLQFDTSLPFGYDWSQQGGAYVTGEHLAAFDEVGVLFKGPVTIPPGDLSAYVTVGGRRFTSGNQVFRKTFQLFANVRPARTFTGVATGLASLGYTPAACPAHLRRLLTAGDGDGDGVVDLVVVRENTEDLYTGEEAWVDDDTVEGVKRNTRSACARVSAWATAYALAHHRRRITVAHKANVMKLGDSLFLEEARAAAAAHGDGVFRVVHGTWRGHGDNTNDGVVVMDDQLADSLLYDLVLRPTAYDVILAPNLFGDLLSDMAGALVGSLGLLGSANIGHHHAAFEPAHGSAPDIAGGDVANPVSQIMAGVALLQHLGEPAAAARVVAAVDATFAAGVLPVDLGGNASCSAFTDAVVQRLWDGGS